VRVTANSTDPIRRTIGLVRPRTATLFMLVSALMGLERTKDAFAHASESKCRFYSYGDRSPLIPWRRFLLLNARLLAERRCSLES
jgi:hypothetical protein